AAPTPPAPPPAAPAQITVRQPAADPTPGAQAAAPASPPTQPVVEAKPAEPAVARPAAAPAQLAAAPSESARAPLVAAAEPPAPPRPRAEAPAPAAPAPLLAVRALPEGARLWLDGQSMANPFDVRLPRGSKHKIEARSEGYEASAQTVRIESDAKLTITLRRVLPPPAPHVEVKPLGSQARGAGFVTTNPY
ncbi:MAG: hypothetical protein ABW321_31875, partial [Polyangiales bacterium]